MIQLPRSLQGRLLTWVLTVVVGVWLATAAMTWVDVRHELDELLDGHLAQAAAVLVIQQTPEMGDGDETGADAPTLHRYAPKVVFQIFHEGHLVLRSATAPLEPMVGAHQAFKPGFDTVTIGDGKWRVFAAHGSAPDVQVYVGEEIHSRAAILWAVLRSTLLPTAVALPLLALAMWWAVSRGLLPLRQLGRTLALRQPQALDPIAPDDLPSEMAPMVTALNDLFARMGTLLESERRFTADAAHELRTPIAAIRAQAQVALMEGDDALRRHALHNTLEGCDRAVRLVEQLLTLSRLEATATPAMAAVDLAALSQRVVGELAPKAIGKQQTLEFEASGPCPIPGNETLLTVLVRNLVDNAVRYSPPSAHIHVTVRHEADQLVLQVEDSGPGMTDDELHRLGERFFRVPGNAETGSGLGWSIVKRIAAVHGLELHVAHATALGGLEVRVSGRATSP